MSLTTILPCIGCLILGFMSCILLAGCVSGPSSEGYVTTYNEAVERAHRIPTFAAGSDSETRAIEGWKRLLADLSEENMKGRVGDVYADKLFFNDTLKTITDVHALEEHFLKTAAAIDSGTVEYLATTRDGHGDYYVRWEMSFAGPKLNGGEPIVSIGVSQLRFDQSGKCVLHQDFWDSTSGLFEYVPVLGNPIRYLRSRM